MGWMVWWLGGVPFVSCPLLQRGYYEGRSSACFGEDLHLLPNSQQLLAIVSTKRSSIVARRADPQKVETFYNSVKRHPGKHKGFFARVLDWHRQKVERTLVQAEDEGLLLYEDEKGRLWPFGEE